MATCFRLTTTAILLIALQLFTAGRASATAKTSIANYSQADSVVDASEGISGVLQADNGTKSDNKFAPPPPPPGKPGGPSRTRGAGRR